MRANTFVLAGFATLALFRTASAVTISAIDAQNATSAPFTLGNFGNAGSNGFVTNAPIAIAGGLITFATGGSPNAGVYDGSVNGVVASAFTNTQMASRNYLSAEPGSAITFSFTTPQTQFQLLWSTVDAYNSLVFTRADNSTVTITGSDILAVDGGELSAFVTVSNLGSFTSVTATTSNPAFEFVPSVLVPEPASIALLTVGIIGLGWVTGRRAKR